MGTVSYSDSRHFPLLLSTTEWSSNRMNSTVRQDRMITTRPNTSNQRTPAYIEQTHCKYYMRGILNGAACTYVPSLSIDIILSARENKKAPLANILCAEEGREEHS